MKTIYIDYTTLKEYFIASNFKEPVQTEVYYTQDDNGWDLEFLKGSYYIHCRVTKANLLSEIDDPSEEEKVSKINVFETIFLGRAIEIKSFEPTEEVPKKPEPKVEEPPEEIPVTVPALEIPYSDETEPRVDYV